jgi:hypothetical protein
MDDPGAAVSASPRPSESTGRPLASDQTVLKGRRPPTGRCVDQEQRRPAVAAVQEPAQHRRELRGDGLDGSESPGRAGDDVGHLPAGVLAPAQHDRGDQGCSGVACHNRPAGARVQDTAGQGDVKDQLSRSQHDEQRPETPTDPAQRDRHQDGNHGKARCHGNGWRPPTLQGMTGGSQGGGAQTDRRATQPPTDPAGQRRGGRCRGSRSRAQLTSRRQHADRLARGRCAPDAPGGRRLLRQLGAAPSPTPDRRGDGPATSHRCAGKGRVEPAAGRRGSSTGAVRPAPVAGRR